MIIIYLLFLHFIADFILQSREMGKKKSESFEWLARHLAIQLTVFFFGLGMSTDAFYFAGANAIIHGVIDWNIWKLYKYSAHYRIVKYLKSLTVYGNDPEDSPAYKAAYDNWVKKWEYWNDHWFYTTIGFDQLLHASTLVLLWMWLW